MAISLARPGRVAARTKLNIGAQENFSIELSWESSRDIDGHVLMLKNPGNGERAKLLSDDHVLSTFNIGLPLTGDSGKHTEGDIRPFHTLCGTLYHSGNARINKGASVDQIIKVSRPFLPHRINELALFITIFPFDIATMSEVKDLKMVIKNAKKEVIFESSLSDSALNAFDSVQIGSLVLNDQGWEYVATRHGWKGGFGEIYNFFKNATGQSKPAVIEPPKAEPPKLSSAPVSPVTSPRKEIIELDSMVSKFPGIPRETLREARNVIYGVTLSSLSFSECGAWGEPVQMEYTKVVDASYALTYDKCIQESVRHLGRINTLLFELANSFESKKHFWEDRTKPWEALENIRPEIHHLKENLQRALPRLGEIECGLFGINEKSEKLAYKIDIMSVSGQYLSEHLASDANRSNALMTRSLSLVETVAHMMEANILRKSAIDTIETLIARIRDTVLVMLPSWMDSVALFALKSSVTETDLYEARQGITEILSRLK